MLEYLNMQECGIVPAKPFPQPTNGKAVALWKTAHAAHAAVAAFKRRGERATSSAAERLKEENEEDEIPFEVLPGSERPTLANLKRATSEGMRQESYYLRGVVEEERDKDLLSTIANCIPGDSCAITYGLSYLGHDMHGSDASVHRHEFTSYPFTLHVLH